MTRTQTLIDMCDRAINDGNNLNYSFPESVFQLDGMSSRKGRCFLNSLGRNKDIRYIEVGTWKGSTLFSAANPNMAELVSIDNWSEFGGPKADFEANCEIYKDRLPKDFKVLEQDFRKVQLEENRYDCLFYDGHHGEDSQRDAILTLSKFMQKEFIYLVDDYAWNEVKNGTQRGIREAGLEVIYERELPSREFNDKNNYWNGILVAVLRKPDVK